MRFGAEYDVAAQRALDRLMPGLRTGLATELARRRARMLALARDIGSRLTDANWWVLRAHRGEAFVLGDSPVAVTLSLGHDDEWRAILSPESYVIVMPLSPVIALLVAPQRIIPIANIDLDLTGVTRAINRLMWRWADRYVFGRVRSHLEQAAPAVDDEARRSSVPADIATERAASAAYRDVMTIVTDLRFSQLLQTWHHWDGCRLAFGWQPWAPEDRSMFLESIEH